MAKKFVIFGAILAMLAVAFGAFGAHILKDILTADQLANWETAVKYQMYHALGVLFIGLFVSRKGESSALKWAGNLLVAGTIIFSGSLYVLCLTGIGMLGAITPIGGTFMIIGWIMVVIAAKNQL
ncbi:DUF423 domain-containing protein [Brevibacillus daliensis]|uniref:DUF423 domain-containing protein n=1 Tax=Brevibacillus daliensis TaxID=2892995 RepID=UPI001E60E78F|nr:DUF423 domain-containing protein [Brevibacillus daliensis]